MNPVFEMLRNLGPMRVSAIAGAGLALIAFFIFLTSRVASPTMSILFGDLDPSDASQIVAQLEAKKIPYEIKANGSQIFVPADTVLQTRMALAQEGLPGGGSIGYEVFDRRDPLGTTSFVQNINQLRALEGELARTIRSLQQVRAARVHLVLPRREIFTRERQEPTASVVVTTRGGRVLEKEQVRAVQHLVAAAVPRLKPTSVTVIDDKGNLLARSVDQADGGLIAATTEELRRGYEARLARTAEELLERTVGFGRVRAEVSVDMDFDRVTTTSEDFNPERQVVRSTQTVEETSTQADRDAAQAVTVANQLPDANLNQQAGTASNSSERRSEETVNFEISKTVRNQIRESGVVRRVSVAVLVDGVYTPPQGGGEPTYQARTQQELEQMATLVRSAIGYNAERGDTVEVINMRFAPVDDRIGDTGPPTLFGLEKQDLVRIVEIVVLSIVALLVILLVVRPLVTRAFEALPGAIEAGREALARAEEEVAPPPALAAPEAAALLEDEVDEELLIDISRIEGRVKASSVRKISEIVDKHPEEALGIIRAWMYQEG
ncbi:MAG: flagellar M-ring protein FliF [Proteobacteria bacterium]|nr:flagellar M-ring protein FliF [Pseudomonadota bacterium]